jgi:hypothetical protein
MNDPHDTRDTRDSGDGQLPELAAALQHLAGQSSPPGSAEAGASRDVAARLVDSANRSARSALADRLAALLAEVAGRCRPPIDLQPEDVGPELQRLPSNLVDEARRLASRLGYPLPAECRSAIPDDPSACQAHFETLLTQLATLEGDSVRVTAARLAAITRS